MLFASGCILIPSPICIVLRFYAGMNESLILGFCTYMLTASQRAKLKLFSGEAWFRAIQRDLEEENLRRSK